MPPKEATTIPALYFSLEQKFPFAIESSNLKSKVLMRDLSNEAFKVIPLLLKA